MHRTWQRLSFSLPGRTGKSKEDVAKEILRYFVRHPDAADSLLGIARWRLFQEEVHRSVGITEEALQWLVEEGYLRKIPAAGVEDIFRINPAKTRQAKSFLDERPNGENPANK